MVIFRQITTDVFHGLGPDDLPLVLVQIEPARDQMRESLDNEEPGPRNPSNAARL